MRTLFSNLRMSALPCVLAALLCTIFSMPLYADLQAEMSAAEFERAGLNKLSKAELAALQAWLDGDRATAPAAEVSNPVVESTAVVAKPTTTENASPTNRFGQEQLSKPIEADIPEQIAARIAGEFRGWDGKTVFRLDNGQIWRQRVGGKYRSPKRDAPEVVIQKGRFGYYLKVVETGRSVGVKRLR